MHKKQGLRLLSSLVPGGRGWIRTTEVSDNRFTVCPLWPLGNPPIWSWWTESNPRPADYKSAALPAELHQHPLICTTTITSGSPAAELAGCALDTMIV